MNITKDMIIEELRDRGYVVVERIAIKNGIEKEAIAIKGSSEDKIGITIYPEEILREAEEKGLSFDAVMAKVTFLMTSRPPFDVEQFTDPDYIASHVYIGVQREGTEDIVKRKSDFEGIEEYLYLAERADGEEFSVKVTPQLLESVGIFANELFETAEHNNHEEFVAQSMEEVIAEMVGQEAPPCFEAPKMYVISNKRKFRGASAMLDKKGIAELADRIGVHEFILLPSSLHECILVPKTDDVSLETCENMVKEVNASVVDELDQLIDRAYLLTA